MFIKRAGTLFFATMITISILSGCSLSKTEKDDIKINADIVSTDTNKDTNKDTKDTSKDTPKKEVQLAKGFKKEIVPIIEGSKIIYSVSDNKTSDTVLTSAKDMSEVGKYYSDVFKDTKDVNIITTVTEYTAQGEKDGYSFNISAKKLVQGEGQSQITIKITKK